MIKIYFLIFAITSFNAFAQRTIFHEKHGWYEIFPGGDTICSNGKPYSFFWYPGSVNKVVVDFVGGGACWSDKSCQRGKYRKDNDDMKYALDGTKGIYVKTDERNPFKDWHHVIPGYCSGDLFWGDNVKTYKDKDGNPMVVHHKGAVNARAALDWVFKKFESPEKVFMTGTSAGAYGSIYWTPYLVKNYAHKDTKIVHFGDCGSGVVTNEFLKSSFKNWNAFKHLPKWVPGLENMAKNWENKRLKDIYSAISNYLPEVSLGQFSYAYDTGQTVFLEMMVDESGQDFDVDEFFFRTITDYMEQLKNEVHNYHYYVAPGFTHTIIDKELFYTMESGGVKFFEWFNNLLDSGDPRGIVCSQCELE